MDDISKMLRDQNRVMTALAAVFAVWQGATFAREITIQVAPELGDTAIRLADIVETVGGILWVLVMVAFLLVARRVKQARAQNVLQDELYQHNKSIALKVGFKAMVALIIVLLGFEVFFELTSGLIIRAMMLVAVLAPLSTFIILSRDDNLADT